MPEKIPNYHKLLMDLNQKLHRIDADNIYFASHTAKCLKKLAIRESRRAMRGIKMTKVHLGKGFLDIWEMKDPITNFCIFARGSSQATEVSNPRRRAIARFPKKNPVFCRKVQSTE